MIFRTGTVKLVSFTCVASQEPAKFVHHHQASGEAPEEILHGTCGPTQQADTGLIFLPGQEIRRENFVPCNAKAQGSDRQKDLTLVLMSGGLRVVSVMELLFVILPNVERSCQTVSPQAQRNIRLANASLLTRRRLLKPCQM